MKSKIETFYVKHDDKRINLGDVFKDFEHVKQARVVKGAVEIDRDVIPYFVVLTQDCDLEQDFKNHEDPDKDPNSFLISILICPAYNAELFKNGEHLSALGLTLTKIGNRKWENIYQKNRNYRYHFLDADVTRGIPGFIIDFKHYLTIPRDVIYENPQKYYLCTINELFRESLSQRFAYYLSRIGLPEFGKKSEKKVA